MKLEGKKKSPNQSSSAPSQKGAANLKGGEIFRSKGKEKLSEASKGTGNTRCGFSFMNAEKSLFGGTVNFSDVPEKISFTAGKSIHGRRENLKVRARKRKPVSNAANKEGLGDDGGKRRYSVNLPITISDNGVLTGSSKRACNETSLLPTGSLGKGGKETGKLNVEEGEEDEIFMEEEETNNLEAVSAEHHRLSQ